MDIGKETPAIVVEPVEDPLGRPARESEPAREPRPVERPAAPTRP